MSYYYPTGTAMPPSQSDKAGIYSPYPQPGGLPGMGVGAGQPGGMPLGYPSSNGLSSSGLGGIPRGPGSISGMPPSSSYGGIPPSSRSPISSMAAPGGMSMVMSHMPAGMHTQNGMGPSGPGGALQHSPHGGLGPSGPGIPPAQLQAYPHLAGAAGYSASGQPSIYAASSLGSSPYSTQAMPSAYPSSMHLNGGPMQSPYSGLSSGPSTMASQMNPYAHGLTSYPSAMPGVSPSAYGMSALRGPSNGAPAGYPGMSALGGSAQGPYPGAPSNPSMLRTSPLVPTPGYPGNPYGRPL